MRWFHRDRGLEVSSDELRSIVTRDVALAERLDGEMLDRLLELTDELVRDKLWEPAAGFELVPEMAVTIAANAAIPVLALDVGMYRNVRSIIVWPGASTADKLRAGPSEGVVVSGVVSTSGEAAPHRGPVSISWDSALAESRAPESGRNVIIHEFAHKIDMVDGAADGAPPLRGESHAAWVAMLEAEFGRSDVRPADDALRPYAWSNPAEFFAVASEAFFCTPERLRGSRPELYTSLRDVYLLDPAG